MFGVHLNKGKSLIGKKSLFCSMNNKTLCWSKDHGWTTVQSIPDDRKGPKSEYREVNEVRMYQYIISLYIYILKIKVLMV